jgi:outer membrane protein
MYVGRDWTMNTQGRHRQRAGINKWMWTAALAALLLGCQKEPTNLDGSISAYRDRMLTQHQEQATAGDSEPVTTPLHPVARPVAEQAQLPPRSSLMTQPTTTSQPSPQDILVQVPDPSDAPQVFEQRLERLRQEQANSLDQHVVRNYERVIEQTNEYLKMVSYRAAGGVRPRVRLSLAECVQRAVESNYTIRIEAHNPAISATQIVQAEAAFDVEFFLDTSWAALDPAVIPHSVSAQTDTRSIQGGFRKLLATGAQASVALGEQRQWSDAPQLGPVKTWNPLWPSNFTVTLAQPLLRNFGLDVNRAPITIARIGYQISMDTFVGRVRDTVLAVEQAYWALAQARRRAAIFAESTAQNLITYENMKERLDHDATQVEVSNSESQWKTSYVAYLEFVKIIRDAEDQLKNVLNDPAFKLSDNIEIVPTDTFFVAPIVLDQFAEVRTALDRRSEILAARKQIDQTRVNTMVAKNGILPRLDLSFQYEVQGLGNTGDNSFDNLTTNRFVSYTLGASFSYNFGERAARAAWRRARLQESQAVVTLNQVTDGVVQEVNDDIRTLMVRYMQIPPSLESVQAAERNLRALQARTQRIDPSFLQTELSAVEQLSNTRATLLDVLVGYNVGIVQLEKAKGTLLDYNNIVVSDAQSKK